MKVLVTGATGDLGRRLVGHLDAAGHEVVALCRPVSPRSQLRSFPPRVHQVSMDLAMLEPERLPGGMDAVVSLAQSVHYRQFPAESADIFSVNVTANLRLLEWARTASVRKFVLASSGGIYGQLARFSQDKQESPREQSPVSFYLASKLCAEFLFEGFAPFFQTAMTLRPFFIYGPGQRDEMLIPRLIASVRDGRPIQLQGKEGIRLRPIYVADAAAAFGAALDVQGCHALDVAGPQMLSLREIGETIGRQVGRAPVFEYSQGSPTEYIADIVKTRAMLRFGQTPFDEGIAKTLAGSQ